jgi:hypothetical protein
MARSKAERCGIEAAAGALVLDRPGAEVSFASLAAIALPHKDPSRHGDCSHWSQPVEDGEYHFQSGANEEGRPIGIPFGSKSRLMLIYLQTECVRSGSRVIEIDMSLYRHFRAVNAHRPGGGMSYRMFVEHARRVSACSFTFTDARSATRYSGPIVVGLIRTNTDSSLDRLLGERIRGDMSYLKKPDSHDFPKFAVLGEQFAATFVNDPIRIWSPALALLGNNSVALDIYLWLCSKLPKLTVPLGIPWHDIRRWFGSGYKHQRQMKSSFLEALSLATAVYQEANVGTTPEGLILLPSPSPVQVPALPNERCAPGRKFESRSGIALRPTPTPCGMPLRR